MRSPLQPNQQSSASAEAIPLSRYTFLKGLPSLGWWPLIRETRLTLHANSHRHALHAGARSSVSKKRFCSTPFASLLQMSNLSQQCYRQAEGNPLLPKYRKRVNVMSCIPMGSYWMVGKEEKRICISGSASWSERPLRAVGIGVMAMKCRGLTNIVHMP